MKTKQLLILSELNGLDTLKLNEEEIQKLCNTHKVDVETRNGIPVFVPRGKVKIKKEKPLVRRVKRMIAG